MYKIHVIPISLGEPMHGIGACECYPLEKDGVIIHNAFDCRERFERQGITVENKKWILVKELTSS